MKKACKEKKAMIIQEVIVVITIQDSNSQGEYQLHFQIHQQSPISVLKQYHAN